jgi:ABC-2 type transport system permease protein
MMRALKQLIFINIKLYLREPIATFFTLAFPPLLILLFGTMYGNDPSPLFGGYGTMDITMPAYSALVLGTVGLLSVPITTGGYREQGILRRYRATPLRPLTYIIADVLTNLVITLIGMVVLVAVGWLLYKVQFEGHVLSVLIAVILGGLSMFAVGYLIASVVPGARTAQVVGMVIFYPMMFLSGASVPLEIMPETVRRISDFIPLTYVVTLLRGLWFGNGWGEHLTEVIVLGGVLVVCAGLAARFFRWE